MSSPLCGTVRVVPDKSITHRGVLLGARSRGRTVLQDPNPGDDCRATLRAVAGLGVETRIEGDRWILDGGSLRESEDVIDCGNAGTAMRLLAGLLAPFPFLSILTGDASLRRRPMERIARPLLAMGARIEGRDGMRAPLAIRGGELRPIDWTSPVPSAQVKSAVLLAGLGLRAGRVRVSEPVPSRDHTERLLRWCGVPVAREGDWIVLPAGVEPEPRSWRVPGDISAAVFLLVAASITPGSRVTVRGVGLNPTRTGALDALRRMGARLEVETDEETGPEPIGSVKAVAGPLRPLVIEGAEVPRLIDEIPVLAVAAAMAEGESRFSGLAELRVKESDRIAATSAMLRALGVEVEEGADDLAVRGTGRLRGGTVLSRDDHRIAMAALVAGCAAEGAVEVDSLRMVSTSDPDFLPRLESLRRGGP